MIKNIDMIARWVVRLQDRADKPSKTLSPEDCDTLHQVLDDIDNLPTMTPAIQRQDRIMDNLKLIIGNADHVIIHIPYRFPAPFPARASAILQKYEWGNWGASVQQVVGPRLPSPEHPIFGDHGLMRGILLKPNSQRRSYHIREDFPKRKSAVLGHNGLRVGDWWPYQICALRDGAHGSLIAGISGTHDTFAFSIVISGKYGSLDIDKGDVIFYSDSKALENKNSRRATYSNTTEAMHRSAQLHKPIRVLRSSAHLSKFGVSKGLRYDGLYTITGVQTRHNDSGGAYYRFQLEREPGQAAIDLKRPTQEERYCYGRIDQGY